MRLHDLYRQLGALSALLAFLFFSSAAQACLNTGNLEPCHCIENMMMMSVTPAAGIATPTLTGATAGSASPATSQSFYVGDFGSTNSYYSAGPNNTGGSQNVTINVGDTITWTMSQATTYHTMTTVPSAPEQFDLQLNVPGDTASHTFLHPGTYMYYCTNHDGYNLVGGQPVFFGTQHATITVVAAPEPGGVALLGIAACAGLLRRRR
jgi:plastocyanin